MFSLNWQGCSRNYRRHLGCLYEHRHYCVHSRDLKFFKSECFIWQDHDQGGFSFTIFIRVCCWAIDSLIFDLSGQYHPLLEKMRQSSCLSDPTGNFFATGCELWGSKDPVMSGWALSRQIWTNWCGQSFRTFLRWGRQGRSRIAC